MTTNNNAAHPAAAHGGTVPPMTIRRNRLNQGHQSVRAATAPGTRCLSAWSSALLLATWITLALASPLAKATPAPAAATSPVPQPRQDSAPTAPPPPLSGDAGARSAPLPPMTATPAWVTPVAADLTKTLPADARGVDYLLLDSQTRVTGKDRQNYRHRADRIRTERGLDSTGQVEVSFNPAYQTLRFHQLRIHRDGQVLPWQQRARARWLDRETQLEQGVYDGTRTLSLTLDDLRVGDVLEYAYTVSGANPVFGGRQFGGVELQYAVPVATQVVRLLMPAGREPAVKASTGLAVQRRTLAGGEQEWLWEVRDSQALRMDSGVPAWYSPYARVAWSEFQDWGAVARWAVPMYQPDARPAPALRRELEALQAGFATPQERIAAALRLVQERVRYLSVSIGAGSHAPRRPEQVLAQRFGDCKDKSLLTVALLRGLGVEAWVALVNTELRSHLEDELPSAGAFDHAIVLARWEGKDYWLDPTRTPQRGTLENLVQADFGRALVIDPATTALTTIATAPSSVDRREMDIDFDLSQGTPASAGYQVTTRYFGAAAERMRNDHGSGEGRLERLQKLFLGYYARSFNNIKVVAPLEWEDDEQANRLTVTEHYTVGQLWTLSRRGDPLEALLLTPDMDALFQRPDMSERQHPLQRNHPERLDMAVRVQLPQAWRPIPMDAGEHTVKDDHFSFRRLYALNDHTLGLKQHYTSLSDHVMPEKMADYLKHLKEADEWSGYRLKWSQGRIGRSAGEDTTTPHNNTSTRAALTLLAIGLLLGVVRLLRAPALRLKQRALRYPLNRSARHAGTAVAAAGPAPTGDPSTTGASAVQDPTEGPGRSGWRGWLTVWVASALAMHGAIFWLFWSLAKTLDDQVLLTFSHWVYGLGAITLGAMLVRWSEPTIGDWLRQRQLRRIGTHAYQALLWRCGFSDTFPSTPTEAPVARGDFCLDPERPQASDPAPGGRFPPALVPGQD